MVDDQTKLEAATFRRLVKHLQKNNKLQNIDLMNLAGFCRNCLSKWMNEEAGKMSIDSNYESMREKIYGMPYETWKKKFQKPLD